MDPIILTLAAVIVMSLVLRAWLRAHTVVIDDYEDAVLVRDGRPVRGLATGRHLLWRTREQVVACDRREQVLAVTGQEVMTSDDVPVKVTLTLRYRLLGAREQRAVADWEQAVYVAAQHALREAAGAVELQELLTDRAAIDQAMTERLRQEAPRLALEEVRADVKDLMVGGELKRALGDVAKARAEGRARLERARGETAALRNLTNAAQLLEKHAGLARLRLLEVAAAAAQGPNNQLVLRLNDDVASAE